MFTFAVARSGSVDRSRGVDLVLVVTAGHLCPHIPGLAVAAIVCVNLSCFGTVLLAAASPLSHARKHWLYSVVNFSLSNLNYLQKSSFDHIANRTLYNTLIKYFGEIKIFPPHSLKWPSQCGVAKVYCYLSSLYLEMMLQEVSEGKTMSTLYC